MRDHDGLTIIVERFLEQIRVCDCGEKVRVGPNRDGGYVMLPATGVKTLWSLGIGDDASFEMDFIERFGAQDAMLFDSAMWTSPVNHPAIKFFQRKIGALAGASPTTRNVLKMDVEWDEWSIIHHSTPDSLATFEQIVCEFHIINVTEPPPIMTPYFDKFYRETYRKITAQLFGFYFSAMRKLTERFHIFHVHANNSLPIMNVGGWWVPPLLEISFVRKDLAPHARPVDTDFPIPGLDFPNKGDRPDVFDYYPWRKAIRN